MRREKKTEIERKRKDIESGKKRRNKIRRKEKKRKR